MYSKNVTSKENFEAFWREVVLNKFPQAKIEFKTDSTLMHFLGFFSRQFRESMTTVIGNTIYFPDKDFLVENYEQGLRMLSHEFVHMVDQTEEQFFKLRYLLPQILAVFSFISLAAFWNLWFLLALLFLVVLAPGIPSDFRTRVEANAYTMTLFMRFRGVPINESIENEITHLSSIFLGSGYWYMARSRQLVESMLKDRYERLPETHTAFIEVKKWLQISTD
jgi:hypothetical protein